MEILTPLLEKATADLSLGRMLESLVLLKIIWMKLEPKLKKFDDRIAGLATVVENGFKSGESRFQKIEERVTALEKPTEGSQHDGKSL